MPGDRATRWLLAGGAIGPVLFVVAFLIEGMIRSDYDAVRVFVSQLSLGVQGWLQIANFVVSGLLIIAFAAGLRRVMATGPASRWGPRMVGVVGFGFVIAGIFVTDPALGYPPGTPPGLTLSPSWHGSVHLIGALFVFGGLPIACFVFARRFRAASDRSWRLYTIASGIGMLAFFVTANLAANGAAGLGDVAGLLQRVAAVIGLGWMAVLAAWLVRSSARVIAWATQVAPGAG